MSLLQLGDQIGLVACSNAQPISNKEYIQKLITTLKQMGFEVVCSPYLFAVEGCFSGSAKEKADAFMTLYKDENIRAIFDISGGDLANEVIPYLDYEFMRENPKPVFGYSDLTTVLNAIYTKTSQKAYLYQIRNIIGTDAKVQMQWAKESLLEKKQSLFNFSYQFLQGESLEGVVIGGNIRCFLKLAGTPYFPDCTNKILLLESMGGGVPQMITFLNQYKQMGIFNQIQGIILGTFSKMEETKEQPTIERLVMDIVSQPTLPIIKTKEIGHGSHSKCMIIGEQIKIYKK